MSIDTVKIAEGIKQLVARETIYLESLSEPIISTLRNHQDRTIKELVGHMIDSASNNHQRMIRLQYNEKLVFPDYTQDNDRWIGLQRYNDASWGELVQLWKLYNQHISHIIEVSDGLKLGNTWTDFEGNEVTLGRMMDTYLWHQELHLEQIRRLAESKL